MDFDNLERMIIDNQKSINRLLSAIQVLKKQQDDATKEVKDTLDVLQDSKLKELLKESSEELCLYTIQNGEWYFNNQPTGVKAIGMDGKDGKNGVDGKDGKDGSPGKAGKDGKDGKDGRNGLPGRDGIDGKNGKPGKDGKDGKDIDLRIGKVETVDDKASAKLRKENDIQYLDLKLPRGPQGFMGFDGVNGKDGLPGRDGVDGKDGEPGKDGKDGTINGYNEIIIEAGKNISLDQQDNKIVINSESGTELTGGDNIVIEDNTINVYTNTGYKVIDENIEIQSIIDSGTTGTNKIVYIDDEVMFIIDGTNKLRRSKNGIDFEVLTLPRVCKDLVYNSRISRLIAVSNDGYFFYSEDLGDTWIENKNTNANNVSYLFVRDNYLGFMVISTSLKRVTILTDVFGVNSYITSTIVPKFICLANATQYIWCNSSGTFKYGAGATEGDFASLSGVEINLLKRVNGITMVGLKNDNKMYLLEPANSIRDYKWIKYDLKDNCTLNDIIYNPHDETYYLFTNINTYYKTKDFINYDTVNKNNLRGIQGYFTLMGIQMTTFKHNELLLAPTTTTLENKAQEWDRGLDKTRWTGLGMEVVDGKLQPKINEPLRLDDNGIGLKILSDIFIPSWILEASYVAIAKLREEPISPYDMDTLFWVDFYPSDGSIVAHKIIFNEEGSFFDQLNWDVEYTVAQHEYGYIYVDVETSLFKYVKLGNLSLFLN